MLTLLKIWILTSRPKTLLLSASGILTGNALAFTESGFKPAVFSLTLITAALLQILSNFCNDFGDFSKGTDQSRIGPKRAIHLNLITLPKLKQMIWMLCGATVISGLLLLYLAYLPRRLDLFLSFIILGGLSILAAIQYTMGKKPYGYIGLGDLSVFIFFGPVSVCGSYFLQSQQFSADLLLPASALGLFSVGVLNINNMRDADSDKRKEKITFSVILGKPGSKIYQIIITVLPIVLITAFMLIRHYPTAFILINAVTIVFFIPELYFLIGSSIKINYNAMLAMHSTATFLYASLYFIGHVILFE